tara:strand:- start:93 stop:443 length:351 start_codon:yes stop_codon:yes gene_type:complete
MLQARYLENIFSLFLVAHTLHKLDFQVHPTLEAATRRQVVLMLVEAQFRSHHDLTLPDPQCMYSIHHPMFAQQNIEAKLYYSSRQLLNDLPQKTGHGLWWILSMKGLRIIVSASSF